ncbi:MAG: hypothetical protein S0880_07365 [Actinomycetota bacterium]|nr:hypothetical protein [Actinomycetota bacterium]
MADRNPATSQVSERISERGRGRRPTSAESFAAQSFHAKAGWVLAFVVVIGLIAAVVLPAYFARNRPEGGETVTEFVEVPANHLMGMTHPLTPSAAQIVGIVGETEDGRVTLNQANEAAVIDQLLTQGTIGYDVCLVSVAGTGGGVDVAFTAEMPAGAVRLFDCTDPAPSAEAPEALPMVPAEAEAGE